MASRAFHAAAILAFAMTADAGLAAMNDVPPLHRPRDREYDVIKYRLTIEADLPAKTVSGEAEITLTPIRPLLDEVRLDAAAMTVRKVRVNGVSAAFSHEGEVLAVDLGRIAGAAETLTVSVDYSVTAPPKGLYFSGPDESEPEKPWQLYSQGEPEENRYWFPCYDFPNDKASSETIVTADARFTAISNGVLVGVTPDAAGKKRTWHWRQDLPHVSYLVSIVVGEFALVEDRWRDVPILNYVRPADVPNAPRSFSKTPRMMDLFSSITGRDYPWAKYGHATVQDFIWAGQENVSISTLTDGTLHDARAHLDRNSDGLVAHELAHQWFGNLVSFRDWSEAWLSEGFATYLTLLSEGDDKGADEFSYQLRQTQENVANTDVAERRRPTVTKRYFAPGELFDNRIYGKGACVLHMLRTTLGDSLFYRGLRAYVKEYAFRSAETHQFRLAMEEATGVNLDWFFEQWVYGAGHPRFEVDQRWDEATRSVTVSVRQTQERDSLTGLFRAPVEILVWVGDDPETYVETVSDTLHEFTYPAYREPKLVLFDRGSALLKSVTFHKPAAQWIEQLRSAEDAADRAAAVAELRWIVDTPAVRSALLEALIRDRFWGVRYEAALALADARVPATGDSLVPAYGDRDARVRGAVIRALGNFRGDAVLRAIRHAFATDSSYVVAANAVAALAKADSANAPAICLEALGRDSHDEAVRSAALRAFARLEAAPGARDTVIAYTRKGRPRNLRTLAIALLARHWPEEDELRHVAGFLEDASYHVRRAAVEALGNAGKEEAIEPLRRRLAVEPDGRLLGRIREAISQIEAKQD